MRIKDLITTRRDKETSEASHLIAFHYTNLRDRVEGKRKTQTHQSGIQKDMTS